MDAITRQRIIEIGFEEKAKSEKLIAGDNPCPIWDAFVQQRSALLSEGDAFISENNLA